MKRIFSILFALVLVVSFSLVTAVPVAAATSIYVNTTGSDLNDGQTPGTAVATITKGIELVDSGGTVYVAAGTYSEYVVIGKPVTLLGANAGVHPAVGTHPTETVGTRGPETILANSYYALKPQADDITVDGFKFTGAGGRIIDTYADANNFHLTNCIFDNPTRAVTQGVIQFGGGSHTDMLIDYNLFQDQGDHTLYFGGGPYDRLHIAYNKFNGLGDGMFWTATPLVDGIVEGNEFDGTISGTPGQGGVGMNIGQGGNIIIRNNWFHDMFYTGFQVGIVGGSVTDNMFERIYPYPGYWADVFQLWGGEWGTPVSTNVVIERNTIRYNDISGASDPSHGIRLRSGADAPNVHINWNNFEDGGARTDAFAVRNQGTGVLDAIKNWWGHASGPSGEDGRVNKKGKVIGKGGAISGNVNWDPWLPQPIGHTKHDPVPPGLR